MQKGLSVHPPDRRTNACPSTLTHDRWQEESMPVVGTMRCIMVAAWHEVVLAPRPCACTRVPYKMLLICSTFQLWT
jgi:hypothetical protein